MIPSATSGVIDAVLDRDNDEFNEADAGNGNAGGAGIADSPLMQPRAKIRPAFRQPMPLQRAATSNRPSPLPPKPPA